MIRSSLFAALLVGSISYCPEDAFAQTRDGLVQHAQALTETLRSQWEIARAVGRTPATVIEPTLMAGAVLTPNVDVGVAPGLPALQVTVKSGTVGLNSLLATLTSPDGQHSITSNFVTAPAYPALPAKTTIKFTINSPFTNSGFGLYTEPGAWALSGLTLFTKDGQVVIYGPSQLADVFSSTIVNIANSGTPDIKPPRVFRGTVLTPTVFLSSISPTFVARLIVSDDISGVSVATIGIAGPAGSGFSSGAYTEAAYPVTGGSVLPSVVLPQGSPVGTYSITGVTVCDVVENCVTVSDPIAVTALFGTDTFKVMN